MGITSVNQASSGITPTNQSNQDSYEKNIQKQITRLQQEIKDITCDREKSSEEKASEKRTLQEQIQNLNSELKQYQVQKKTEEAAKKRETAAKSREVSIQPEAGVIISISNTKEQVLCMKKIRTGLEGRKRTADTEQEKLELQERINHVSQSMGEKVKKIADTIAENQRTEQERKDKVYEIQQEKKREREERREAMNVVLPTSRTNKTVEADRREENFVITGKVSVT